MFESTILKEKEAFCWVVYHKRCKLGNRKHICHRENLNLSDLAGNPKFEFHLPILCLVSTLDFFCSALWKDSTCEIRNDTCKIAQCMTHSWDSINDSHYFSWQIWMNFLLSLFLFSNHNPYNFVHRDETTSQYTGIYLKTIHTNTWYMYTFMYIDTYCLNLFFLSLSKSYK
jgi:hypothetical protein